MASVVQSGAIRRRRPRSGRATEARRPTAAAHAALIAIASAIAERGSASELAELVVSEVRRLVPCDRGAVSLWLPGRDALRVIATSTDGPEVGLAAGEVIPLNDCAYRSVVDSRTPLRETDLSEHDTPTERLLAAAGLRARVVVPVAARGRTIAILGAFSRRRGAYAAAHERLLSDLAIHLAVGLEQAQLVETTHRHEQRLLGLQRVAQRLAARAGGQDLLDLVLDEAVRSMDGDTGTLLMWDERQRALVPVRNTVPTAREYTVLRPGQGVAGRAIRQMRVVILHDYQRESGDETPAGKTGVRAAIGAPLIADGELLGAVTANTLDPNKRFDPADAQVFELFAGQAAAVIKTARLFESERRQWRAADERRRQLEAVRAVTAEITRELDLGTLLELIWLRAAALVGGKSGVVYLWDEAEQVLVPRAWQGFDEWIADLRVAPGEGAGIVAQRRAGMIVNDFRASPHALPIMRERAATTASLAAPILYQDRLIGVITINRESPDQPFTEHDLELLGLFAGQAAIAIENARLFEQVTTVEAMRELAQLKTEFLNTVSHELRTPLTLIHGYAEILVHRAPLLSPERVRAMSAEIHASSRTLRRLVDDLLDFSRLEGGRLQLRRREVVVTDLLGGLVETFRAQPHGERIQADLPAPVEAHVDPERITQVVGNFLSNALRYAPEGPIVLRAGRWNGALWAEVEDRGPGIPPEDLPKIWERFYRGAQAVHSPNRGSGIGLAVAKHLVELHGGEIGVRSAPNQGATFWFSLPADAAE